jgi:hypothetical protein
MASPALGNVLPRLRRSARVDLRDEPIDASDALCESTSVAPRLKRAHVLSATYGVLTCASFWFVATCAGFLPFCIVPVAIGALTKQLRALVAVFVFSPMMAGFVAGCLAYGEGHPHLLGGGLLDRVEDHNPDPIARVPWSTSGCLVGGGEWLFQTPFNHAVRGAVLLFGYVPGSYDGPYPTCEEASASVREPGPELLVSALEADRVELDLGTRRVTLAPGVGPALASAGGREEVVRIRQIGERVLVLGFSDPFDDGPWDVFMVLVDARSGRPFAYYGRGVRYERLRRNPAVTGIGASSRPESPRRGARVT